MKLLILFVAITWSNAAKLDKTYLPPRTAPTSGGSGSFLQTPFSGAADYQSSSGLAGSGDLPQGENAYSQNANGFNQPRLNQYNNVNVNNYEARPERAQAAFERNAAILRQDNQNDGETYAYAYETENGIVAEENGVATNGVEAQGGFSYTGDDGQVYSIRYTADQNGFVPQGDHLPTPPPVPEEILRALEQNARDEAAGIYDDGSYNEAKYGSGDEYKSNNAYNNYNNNIFSNQNERQDDEDSVVTNSAAFRNQGSFNNGAANQPGFNTEAFVGGRQGSEANKAYLPPFASQKSFGSRSRPQSFNSRTGYRY